MLKIKKRLWPLFAVLSVLVSGCSTTSKHTETVSADPPQNTSHGPLKKHTNWKKNHLTQLSLQDLNLSVLDDDSAVAPQTVDVWQRIRDGYGLSEYHSLQPETQNRLTWFVNNPEYVDKVVERARPYLFHIVDALDRRNMPLEIALLPIVESGYQPFALSSGQAAGIWQFIPATGRVFGLEQNWWYDGRRDVIQSTTAALDYLQKLHNDFNDWELAIAAYNAGEGTVGRAIKKNQEAGLPTDFWSLELPAETTAYIPKLLALAHLVKQPAHYDLTLSPINNEPYLSVINVGSQIDLSLAADLAEITLDELYLLNPGFNRWATAPQGPHNLVLPSTKVSAFKTALSGLSDEDLLRWKRHEVKPGESLSTIASQHQTTVPELKKANKLTSNFLRAGAHLLIPISTAQADEAEANAINNRRLQQGKKLNYSVKAGDTWWNIAKAYTVDVFELTQWNDKTPSDVLHSGQQLVIWQPKQTQSKLKTINYTIRNGDSLWTISRKFNVTVDKVKEWNGLSDRTLLQPGQKLTLYVDPTLQIGHS
tara:strand:+ start:671 stop:2281 length:1611 start_codon:yes stop_codon:yes gene_type:complete